MGKIFISYKSEEYKIAEHLAKYLEGRGFETWFAPRNIIKGGGGDYDTQIDNAIKDCRAFILLLSKNSDISKQVKRELKLALDDYDKGVFPLRIDDVKPDNLRYLLGTIHIVEWLNKRDETLNELIDSILKYEEKKKQHIPPEGTSHSDNEHEAHHVKFTEKIKSVLKNSISWLENLSKKQKIAACLCFLAVSIMGAVWNWRYGVPGTKGYLPPKPFDGFELVSSCTAGQFQRGLVRWETSRDFNFMNDQGNTALYVAAEKNIHPDAIKLMLNETKKLGVQEYEKRINKALEIAIENNPNPEVIKIFVNTGATKPKMAVFLATKNNTNISVIKIRGAEKFPPPLKI